MNGFITQKRPEYSAVDGGGGGEAIRKSPASRAAKSPPPQSSSPCPTLDRQAQNIKEEEVVEAYGADPQP